MSSTKENIVAHTHSPVEEDSILSARRSLAIKLVALCIAVVFVFMSYILSQFVEDGLRETAANVFEAEIKNVHELIEDSLDQHISVLYGAQGFFLAHDHVSRTDWSAFVSGFDLHRRYPALTSMTFMEYVSDENRESFEKIVVRDDSLREEGYPDFTITPEGERDEYIVVKYIEPLDGYESFLGMDFATVHEELLGAVRDKGDLATVGPIDLGRGEEYVFLLPVYKNESYKNTVRARRTFFQGVVAVTLNPKTLLNELFDPIASQKPQLLFEVFDSEDSSLLQIGSVGSSDVIKTSLPLTLAHLDWRLAAKAPELYTISHSEQRIPLMVFLSGIGLSLLLFSVLYLIANARQNALKLAGQMTSELGKFQLAVHNATTHIIITDPEGKIVYANPAVTKTTGYLPEEIMGKTSRFWSNESELFFTELWEHLHKKESYMAEVSNIRKSGEEYSAILNVSPILDRHMTLLGFVWIEDDITERKKLDNVKSEFVSFASHQLRTPLTALRLSIETLMNGSTGNLTEMQMDMMKRSKAYAVRMAETIHTMLTISRLESGNVDPFNTEVKVCSFLHTVTSEYEPETARRNQLVDVQCDDDFTLHTDEKLLREIIVNLHSNAIKYTPDGGTITLSAVKKDASVEIKVKDSGYGIPQDQKERIFEKFFRASNILKKSTDGTGLGLYLVHALSRLLGGSITFESEENTGTTFTLLLPLTPSNND